MKTKNAALPRILVCAAAACLIGTATTSQAVLIGVQFQGGGTALTPGQTAGVLPQSNWNVYPGNAGPAPSPLYDSSHNDSGLSITVSNFTDQWNTGAGTTTANATLVSGKQGGSGVDTGAPSSFTIGGLDNATTYTLYVYTLNDNAAQFTITAGSTTYYVQNQLGSDFALDNTWIRSSSTTPDTFVTGNYVEFAGISPTANSITVTLHAGNPNWANRDVSGFQITAVPEPATWALLAFSLTSVVVFRRRRNSKFHTPPMVRRRS